MYWLFAGDRYYPMGGLHDYIGAYPSVDEARKAVPKRCDWWSIVTQSAATNDLIEVEREQEAQAVRAAVLAEVGARMDRIADFDMGTHSAEWYAGWLAARAVPDDLDNAASRVWAEGGKS